MKTTGREAGSKCVIVDVIDKNFVLITGPKQLSGIKRRRSNVSSVEPTADQVDIKKGADDEEIIKALDKAKKTAEIKAKAKPRL